MSLKLVVVREHDKCGMFHSSGKHGIYTLLDMHQDVLSHKFCGEGVPDWAVDTGSESCDCLEVGGGG